MTIKGIAGNEIQKIYFQLGGQYLTLLNSKKQSGKEYMLYVITLKNMKIDLIRRPSMPLVPAHAPSSSMPAWCFG